MKFLCPYCYTEHEIDEILFRCENQYCRKEPDERLEWYESGMKNDEQEFTRHQNNGSNGDIEDEEMTVMASEGAGHVFSPQGSVMEQIKKKGAPCDICGDTSYWRVCPHCHNRLSEYIYDRHGEKNMIISIIGQPGAGKSVYLGVLLHEIFDEDAELPGILGNAKPGYAESVESSRERYVDTFGKLFAQNDVRTTLDKTKSSIQNAKDNGAYRPFICNIKYTDKSKFPSWMPMLGNNETKSFDMFLFDAAGEDLVSKSSINVANRYLSHSTGIVFLLDPMHLTNFVINLQDEKMVSNAAAGQSKSELLAKKLTSTMNVIEQVASRIREEKGLRGTEAIDIPLAVVIPKCDIIMPFMEGDPAIAQTSPHRQAKGFVLSDSNQIDYEVKGFLERYGARGLISNLENNFSKVRYFAVSALGKNNNPETNEQGQQTIAQPSPHRVEDPLLWLWHEAGVLKGV